MDLKDQKGHTSERIALFNQWAARYNRTVEREMFPLIGYTEVLTTIVDLCAPAEGMDVLDLGIGTGNLAAHFVAPGCHIWGADFSEEMLRRAQERYPQITGVQVDLLNPIWPTELNRRFDRIVSAYVFHEFDLTSKVYVLSRLATSHLSENGIIVIGDVAFPSGELRNAAHQHWHDVWDEEEYYWAADESVEALEAADLGATYQQVSACCGIFRVCPHT